MTAVASQPARKGRAFARIDEDVGYMATTRAPIERPRTEDRQFACFLRCRVLSKWEQILSRRVEFLAADTPVTDGALVVDHKDQRSARAPIEEGSR